MDVHATWMPDEQRYVAKCGGERWFSEDGDNWIGDDGQPLEDAAFVEASIKLNGGPRDGEWIA